MKQLIIRDIFDNGFIGFAKDLKEKIMNKQFLKGLGYAVLMLIFPVISSVFIQMNNITDETMVLIIQAISFSTATILGLILMKINNYKLFANKKINFKNVWWFSPLIVSEIPVLFLGISSDINLSYILVLLYFTIFVGISEEVFFRGLVLNTLLKNGGKYGVLVSSLMFGILHLSNLAGGASIKYVILQVIFAFLFGLVSALLVVETKSLFPVIIWHFAHDFIAFITGDAMILSSVSIIILVFQCFVLLVYCISLWKKIKNSTNTMEDRKFFN